MLRKDVEPAHLFREYARIIAGLSVISHRFRLFLALSGLITVMGALASMYCMVRSRGGGSGDGYGYGRLSFLNSGDLVVVNWVALLGAGLCLRSASKIAHLHRRVVKTACTMHAQLTYEAPAPLQPPTPRASVSSGSASALSQLAAHARRQDAWSQRDTLVKYLSTTAAGISVYGFVLDRLFVHTSLGALLTTTWFILGRSLGA
eukprot:jgi/Mesen1/9832/ME000007S09877